MLFSPIVLALLGTGFTFFLTSAGAGTVLLVRHEVSANAQRAFLGFAGGVMVAASVWSLLLPAIERAENFSLPVWIPAGGGFVLGVFFMVLLDRALHKMAINRLLEGIKTESGRRTAMLVLAVTLHNIPEGMAVGLAFGLAGVDQHPATLAAAIALAIGIGIQNFPEGAAISLPLFREGFSKGRALWYGVLSGIVEPIAGVLGVLLCSFLTPLMPWLLAFAAGAMIYVVFEEIVPEAHACDNKIGTMGAMVGFLVMMLLDVALG